MHRLDRPAAGDESGGEPVEQLGMGRRLAAEPEIGRRGDDPPAEVVLPDPVDHHAGRQADCPGCVSQRASSSRPLPVRRNSRRRLAVQEREPRDPARHDVARTVGIAPPLERGVDRLPLANGVAPGKVRRQRRPLEPDQFLTQVIQAAKRRRVFLRLHRLDRAFELLEPIVICFHLRLGTARVRSAGQSSCRGKPFDCNSSEPA